MCTPRSDATKGKLSHTAYKVLKQTKDFALLEVDLLTGRKHQIRVHLADIGHPVVGDQKYGKGDEAHKRLALHAKSISFQHPFSGEQLTFETKVPAYFNRLVGGLNQINAQGDLSDCGQDETVCLPKQQFADKTGDANI